MTCIKAVFPPGILEDPTILSALEARSTGDTGLSQMLQAVGFGMVGFAGASTVDNMLSQRQVKGFIEGDNWFKRVLVGGLANGGLYSLHRMIFPNRELDIRFGGLVYYLLSKNIADKFEPLKPKPKSSQMGSSYGCM